MKPILSILLFLAVLSSCEDYNQDPSTQFLDCVGITDSFSPYHIVDPYAITLHGQDTFTARLIFTNYSQSVFYTPNYPKWHLWVESHSGSTRYYIDGFCLKNYETDQWYGESGIYYHGQYAWCHFDFHKFNCGEVAGSCVIFDQQSQDSLDFIFAGKK